MRYRQYWMATLKDRRCCQVCGSLAIIAEYTEADDGLIKKVTWLCSLHIKVFDHAEWMHKNLS
jgi:hypothetical protein